MKSMLKAMMACVSAATLAATAAAQEGVSPNSPAASATDTDESARSESALPERERAAQAADGGQLLPQAIAARIYEGHAFAKATAGFDTAVDHFRARAATEGTITNFLAVRVEFAQGPSIGDDTQFGVGARFQFLNQKAHGIDGGAGLFYQPNDFRGEGNILGALLLSRRLGRLNLVGNAMFGGDPEGDDQTAEGRLAALYRVSTRLELGLDNRFRFNTSSDEKREGTLTTDWELQVEPTASLAFGPFALLANAGLSAVQNTGPFGQPDEQTNVEVGVIAMAGAAGAF